MTTRMLINAQRPEQLRVAIIEDTHLEGYETQSSEAGLTRGNIYRGVVANVQPSLNAAFIDLGEEKHGFLPAQDVLPSAYHKKPPKDRRPRIDQLLERGQPILVQVTKDGIAQKGPALTTNVSLAGRYLVLTPYDSVRGISRKAGNDDARKTIRERLKKLNLADGHGVIVRTNGLEQNLATLNRDLGALARLWKKVRGEANKGKGVKLLYSDQDLIVQAMRDHLDNSMSQVIIDDEEAFAKAESYMRAFMPRSKITLTHYSERIPLFSRYRVETQIDRIHDRTVTLPSGGSIVIDGTEALTAIDVNSGRATKGGDQEDSIFKVNVESANEVGRQLRLRDIGGLVVIDFIDMRLHKHQRKLEKVMRDAMKADRARHSVGRISPNGLLEINRQRIKTALQNRSQRPCTTCRGMGTIPTVEFSARGLLRRIEARAASGVIQGVTLALHPEIANALQNLYRTELAALESEFDVSIEIIGAPNLTPLEQRVDWSHRQGVDLAVTASPALTATDLAVPRSQRPKSKKAGSLAESTDEAPAEKPKRKRRRRRRGSGAKAKAARAAKLEKANEQAGGGDEATEPKSGATTEVKANEESDTKKPRRRPPRKRRPSKAAAAKGDSDSADLQTSAESPLEDGEVAPPKKPRRRTAKKKTTSPSAAKSAAEPKVELDGFGDPITSRESKSRTPATDAAKKKDNTIEARVEALAAEVTAEAVTSPDADSKPKATKKATKAKPKKATSKPKVAKKATKAKPKKKADEPDADVKQSKPKAKKKAKAPSAEGPTDAPKAKKKTVRPKAKKRASSEKSTKAGPDRSSNGQRDDAVKVVAKPPSEGLRWQWWGGAGDDNASAKESGEESS